MNFSSSLRRGHSGRFITLLAAVGVLMSLMVIFARPAQAHHPILRVESVCNVETGDIEVTWFLANGNWQGRNMTVDQVTYTDGTGGFSNIVVGKILGPNASTTDVIVYPFSASDTKTLTVRADWDGGGPQDVERSESIDLSKVDRSECQPPEIKPSKIVVKKEVTEGSDTAQSFVFTASYDGDGFSLSHGDSNDSGDLTAGTYSVSEDGPPSGWTLQSAKCVSTDEGDDSRPADINVSEGETVTCTFVNHIPDEVSPTSIVSTTTTIVSTTTTIVSTTVEVSDETLPFTGFENGTTGLLALILVASGALALVGARAFREETDE